MTSLVPSADDAPRWFREALAQAPEHGDLQVDGRRIHTRTWRGGDGRLPGVVLVHGGAAHSGWWDHVAPLLAVDRDVVALDMSGHGDSDHGDGYGTGRWAVEVVAVAEAAGMQRPVLVGHSMGGWVSVATAAEHPEAVGGLVVVDSPLFEQPPEEEQMRTRARPTKVYPELDQALGRFSTLPPQEVLLPYVKDHVARGSLRQVEGGWTWKFDPGMFGSRPPLRLQLPQVRCRTALLRCQHGLIDPAMAVRITDLIPGPTPVVELPDSGHHPMLDQPLVLVATVRSVLAGWSAADAGG